MANMLRKKDRLMSCKCCRLYQGTPWGRAYEKRCTEQHVDSELASIEADIEEFLRLDSL